ncbi:signal recognition particle-docking protein FtsY [Candidatus Woesearchaeota archaeon]|nr:signal recognition particle-docking protein FtsY [Candidatus Woesearchaeota archaeon]
MFKFLKEKLKQGIRGVSDKIEEEGASEDINKVEEPVHEEEPKKKEGFISKIRGRFAKKEAAEAEEKISRETEKEESSSSEEKAQEKEPYEKAEEKEAEEKPKSSREDSYIRDSKDKEEKPKKPEKETGPEERQEREKEKKGLFGSIKDKITTRKISKEQFEKIFWDLEVILLENNVAMEAIEKIKDDMGREITEKQIPRGKIEKTITQTLTGSLRQLLSVDSFSLLEKAKEKKPFVICFVGINGSGKTTTIAKVANMLISKGNSVVLAAADTFRAASIEQLQLHADNLKVKLIKHDYGSDPAAVAFDAVKYAASKGSDIVLIDTAGRIHSNINLTDEMKKIIRVAKPDLKIFVGESITGNDCVEQAKKFNEAIGIDGIILSKADIDEKGGAAISISYVTKKPIIYIGTGQEYSDLKEFDPALVMESLGI